MYFYLTVFLMVEFETIKYQIEFITIFIYWKLIRLNILCDKWNKVTIDNVLDYSVCKRKM